MNRIAHKVAWFPVVFGVLFLLLAGVGVLSGTTAADLSGTIDLKAIDITASGFDVTDNLITETNTLNLAYTNVADADFYTNRDAVTNNNWCERTNDSVYPDKLDPKSNGELTGMWVTWDQAYLYIAIRGQAKGRGNNLMCLIDSNPSMGYNDFGELTTGWIRDILFDEGILPNIYLGFWCLNNEADYNGTDAGGNSQLWYGTGPNSWQQGTQSTSQASPVNFYACYNGTSQSDPTKRLWMMQVSWVIITNSMFVSSTANLEVRLAVASTGPDDNSLMYDYMPETQYNIVEGAKNTIQNNYFIIRPFDGSGNVITGVNPRDTTSVWFNPGSRWDVPNFADGKLNLNVLDDNGYAVKGFTPNGDGNNDTIKFSFQITTRSLFRCTLKVFDLKGRLVRTLIDNQTVALVGSSSTFNDPNAPDNVVEPLLTWDGKTQSGDNAPMGLYIVVFQGEDGTTKLLSKRSIALLR